jgi:hypothetical protein
MIPSPNTGVSVDEFCTTNILGGCELFVPVLAGFRKPLFDVENRGDERTVNVTIGPENSTGNLPSFYLTVRPRVMTTSPDGGPVFENQEQVLIEGREVAFYGNLGGRGASWTDSCLAYSATAIPGGKVLIDPKPLLTDFVRAALLLSQP